MLTSLFDDNLTNAEIMYCNGWEQANTVYLETQHLTEPIHIPDIILTYRRMINKWQYENAGRILQGKELTPFPFWGYTGDFNLPLPRLPKYKVMK